MSARFGPFEVDATRRLLLKNGSEVHLTPKAFDLLSLLVDEAPRVVRKDELHQRLWSDTFVSDATLVGLIKEVRRALDDRKANTPLIRTAHGVGYAFTGELQRRITPAPSVSRWIVPGTRPISLTDNENLIGREPASTMLLDAQAGPSIAVLPFANTSRDADDEYFSDGLAEEIINALAQIPALKVIARTSAFAFKGKNEDIRKIADALGVTTVLEGSVRRADSRVRVTAQLIQASDGTHLWSQRYDREMSDIFVVQDEITMAIAGALKVKLVPGYERRMPSLAAYEAYLQYRSYQWKFTPEAFQRSRECLERALALDPDFALPYVGLADCQFVLMSFDAMTKDEAMPRARDLAMRALELDQDLAEAHAMLGILAGLDYDWAEAERRFRLATAREPLSLHLRQWYACFWLFSTGRAEEAREQTERTIEADPLCQMWRWMSSFFLKGLGRDEEALEASRMSVDLDPQFWLGWMQLGLYYAGRGQHADALPCAERAFAAAPWARDSIGVMAGAFANAGHADKAEALLARLRDDSYGGPIGLCLYSLCRGEIEQAAEWALKAAERRHPSAVVFLTRPHAPQFRKCAAWPALLRALNLPS